MGRGEQQALKKGRRRPRVEPESRADGLHSEANTWAARGGTPAGEGGQQRKQW